MVAPAEGSGLALHTQSVGRRATRTRTVNWRSRSRFGNNPVPRAVHSRRGRCPMTKRKLNFADDDHRMARRIAWLVSGNPASLEADGIDDAHSILLDAIP